MVVGVGGGGGNAVNHMYRQGLTDVSFMVCNTDAQALSKSPVANKIQMGEGLGAGSNPDKARLDAQRSIDEIKEVFVVNNTQMVFVTAGMGGGTGTGAAPVIAAAAKEMGILTVAIVTIPFESEGRPRVEQAIAGIAELSKHVDSLIVINNAHIVEIYGDLPFRQAFAKADDILAIAARSISEIIIHPHVVNVDFADVTRVMKDSGVAIMGSAVASGEGRAIKALNDAMSSPLLHHRSIAGAVQALVNISSCEGEGEITMSEAGMITSYIQEKSDNNNNTNLIWGIGFDDTLQPGEIRATVVATGFDIEGLPSLKEYYQRTLGGADEQQKSSEAGDVDPSHYVPVRKYRPEREVIDFDGDQKDGALAASQREQDSDTSEFEVVDIIKPSRPSREVHSREVLAPVAAATAPSVAVASEAAEASLGEDASSETSPEGESVEQELLTANRSIGELSPDELENIPAWKRREMEILSLRDARRVPSRREREVLDYDDEPSQSESGYHTIDLFDE